MSYEKATQLIALTLWAILAGCGSAGYQSPPDAVTSDLVDGPSNLTVRVVGLDSSSGELALALYDSAEAFAARRDPVAKARLPIQDKEMTWRVDALTPGRYAVAAYHDADSDGELDRAITGWPTESYGFSNDARSMAGPPGFKAAAFNLVAGDNQIEIGVR